MSLSLYDTDILSMIWKRAFITIFLQCNNNGSIIWYDVLLTNIFFYI
jgi:hypothetical protein